MSGTTALQWAATRGQAKAAIVLLDLGGAPLDGRATECSLAQAIKNGHNDMARRMLDLSIEDERAQVLPQILPLANDRLREELLQGHAWRNQPYIDPRGYALEAGDTRLYDSLHAIMGSSSALFDDYSDWRALRADADAWRSPGRYDLGMTAHILGVGRPIKQRDLDEALRLVFIRMRSPAALALLDAGAFPNDTAMRYAAWLGDPRVIHRLAEMGLNPDGVDPDKSPPLFIAVFSFDADTVEALLQVGATPTFDMQDQTMREWFAGAFERVSADPSSAPESPYVTRPDEVRRILDLLEAAETEWCAREGSDAEPEASGGP